MEQENTNQTFTYTEFKLLNKTSTLYQTQDNLTEIYFRKIKIISTGTLYLRHILAMKHSELTQDKSKDTHHSVKSFIEAVDKDLSHPKVKQEIEHNNLTKDELLALESFKKRDDIIITKADIGVVVIISLEDYIKEEKRQLDNTEFYTKLEVNPTQTHGELTNNTICNFAKEKILPIHVAKALIIDETTVYQRYIKSTTPCKRRLSRQANYQFHQFTICNSTICLPSPTTYSSKTEILHQRHH